MSATAAEAAKIVREEFAGAVGRKGQGSLVIGLAGAQGSGKTTVASTLVEQYRVDGFSAAALSLDDFYLAKAERLRLAARIHPLFETRGPPGTHDVARAIDVIDAIRRGAPVRAPSFDKGVDDRRSPEHDFALPAALDVLIFEGWCVGATAEEEASLVAPINELERKRDPDGVWRRAVNDFLKNAYQDLFARLDRLVFLRAPSFDVVCGWRLQQEHDLAASVAGASALMSPDDVALFIQHYERITRRMLRELPARADLTVNLDADRRIESLTRR